MTTRLTRRSWLGQLVGALFAWVGLRPAAAAPAPPGCPHPAHQPLCADRPGEGWWYRTRLRLACPRCGATVSHEGYLPDTPFADCRAVPPPGYAEPCDSRSWVTTSTYDAAGDCIAMVGPAERIEKASGVITYTYDSPGSLGNDPPTRPPGNG